MFHKHQSNSKLTTTLVNVSVKFERKYYKYAVIFVGKCENLLHLQKIFTFFQQKITAYLIM